MEFNHILVPGIKGILSMTKTELILKILMTLFLDSLQVQRPGNVG